MQENNFEKQMQGKMDELKLNPSAELWQKVELHIKKDKRDRRMLAVCLLSLLLLIIAGITWVNTPAPKEHAFSNDETTNGKTDSISLTNASAPPSKMADQPGEKGFGKETVKVPSYSQPGTKSNQLKTTSPALLPGQPGGMVTTGLRTNKFQDGLPKPKRYVNTSSDYPFVKDNGQASEQVVASTKGLEPDQNKLLMPEESGRPTETDQREVSATRINRGAFDLLSSEFLKLASDSIKDTGLSTMIGTSRRRGGWRLGFTFSPGISITRNGYLGLLRIAGSDENKDLFQSPATGNTGNNGNPGTPTSSLGSFQSSVTLNAGFIAGAFVQKELSARTNLLIGINYKYYSTKMMVGARVDSVSGQSNYDNAAVFYRAGSQNSFVNRYHFIELPIGLQFRISPTQKRPVYVYTGLSIARLLGTNALEFNTLTASYRENKSVFTKTQFDLSAKLLFALSRSNKNGLLAGPHFSYSLGKMAGSGMYTRSNYSFVGLAVQKNIR